MVDRKGNAILGSGLPSNCMMAGLGPSHCGGVCTGNFQLGQRVGKLSKPQMDHHLGLSVL